MPAGSVDVISKTVTIESATSVDAKDTFSNNNLFRQASFRERKGLDTEGVIRAAEAFRETFGSDVRELNAGVVVGQVESAET